MKTIEEFLAPFKDNKYLASMAEIAIIENRFEHLKALVPYLKRRYITHLIWIAIEWDNAPAAVLLMQSVRLTNVMRVKMLNCLCHDIKCGVVDYHIALPMMVECLSKLTITADNLKYFMRLQGTDAFTEKLPEIKWTQSMMDEALLLSSGDDTIKQLAKVSEMTA